MNYITRSVLSVCARMSLGLFVDLFCVNCVTRAEFLHEFVVALQGAYVDNVLSCLAVCVQLIRLLVIVLVIAVVCLFLRCWYLLR